MLVKSGAVSVNFPPPSRSETSASSSESKLRQGMLHFRQYPFQISYTHEGYPRSQFLVQAQGCPSKSSRTQLGCFLRISMAASLVRR